MCAELFTLVSRTKTCVPFGVAVCRIYFLVEIHGRVIDIPEFVLDRRRVVVDSTDSEEGTDDACISRNFPADRR